jgi:hypothetical protein
MWRIFGTTNKAKGTGNAQGGAFSTNIAYGNGADYQHAVALMDAQGTVMAIYPDLYDPLIKHVTAFLTRKGLGGPAALDLAEVYVKPIPWDEWKIACLGPNYSMEALHAAHVAADKDMNDYSRRLTGATPSGVV